MSTRWVALEILRIKRTAEPARFNPHPVGVMWPGSATEAVHRYLSERAGRGWVQRRQIVAATGRSGKAVDWALIFLRANKLVEASEDPRNTRYLRYRAARKDPS